MKRATDLLVSIVMNTILWVYLLAYIAYDFVRYMNMKELLPFMVKAFGIVTLISLAVALITAIVLVIWVPAAWILTGIFLGLFIVALVFLQDEGKS